MSLISPDYQRLQTDFHLTRPDYGTSSTKQVERIRDLAAKLDTRSILDYGCGKCMLQKGLPFPIQNYDPCMPEYERRPTPAKLVVCTDVLEHIESACLAEVLDDLRSLTIDILYVVVACRPAAKFLPDGRNAHLIVESPNWWLSWLLPRFALHSFQASDGEFMALLRPLAASEPEPTNA